MTVSSSPTARLAERRLSVWELTGLILQVVLVALLVDRYQLESRAFARLALLAAVGFAVHAVLARRWQLQFFVLLSAAGFLLVLGPRNAVWVLGLGSGVIALCHLPVAWKVRGSILALAALGFAAARADLIRPPWSGAVWPVLGSIFMFRLLLYVYDLRHNPAKPGIWESLAYFFLLPNVCFSLFPVVDFKTFRNSRFAGNAVDIYRSGVRWMLRGTVHLLLYRLVYYYGVLAPEEVGSALDLSRFLLSNFALYLRVSGIFHLVIGMLHLFGFNLPETHHFFLLASSINDFWRRINIYWKDFMQKVFYLPAYFRLRRWGATRALVLSTLMVAILSWVLHSYQWFWLRGTFPVRWQDGVFWGALGLLMIANSVWEDRHPKARGRRAADSGTHGFLGRAARVTLTLLFVSTLWSLWTCDSFEQWLTLWAVLPAAGIGDLVSAASLPLLVVGGALAVDRARVKWRPGKAPDQRWVLAALIGLHLLALPPVYNRLGTATSDLVQSLRVARLNRLDAEKLQSGYYEELLSVERFNSQLWEVYQARPTQWLPLQATIASRSTGDYLLRELVPNTAIKYKGVTVQTNRFGMRDREFEREKPPGVFRVALLGASYVMGAGVESPETFKALLEERLAADSAGSDSPRVEILNFAVAGYSPLQRLMNLERNAFAFKPDLVLYVAHENEMERLLHHLRAAHKAGLEPPFPFLTDLYKRVGIEPGISSVRFDRKLRPVGDQILSWVYRQVVEDSASRGIRPVWVYLPTLEMYGQETELESYLDSARVAGFEVISLFGVYDGEDLFSLRLSNWDYHANAAGHRLIADRLYRELRAADLVPPAKLTK